MTIPVSLASKCHSRDKLWKGILRRKMNFRRFQLSHVKSCLRNSVRSYYWKLGFFHLLSPLIPFHLVCHHKVLRLPLRFLTRCLSTWYQVFFFQGLWVSSDRLLIDLKFKALFVLADRVERRKQFFFPSFSTFPSFSITFKYANFMTRITVFWFIVSFC